VVVHARCVPALDRRPWLPPTGGSDGGRGGGGGGGSWEGVDGQLYSLMAEGLGGGRRLGAGVARGGGEGGGGGGEAEGGEGGSDDVDGCSEPSLYDK
jgi:hypothetical protein